MLRKYLIVVSLGVLSLAHPVWAGKVTDPAAGVIDDNFSSPISTFSGIFDPTANGGVLGLFNDTGTLITSISLHTTINTGLSNADISSSFTCNSGPANPFFLHCGFDYVGATGSLTINFFGVNPADGDELNGSETEVGEREGIPAVSPFCLAHPQAESCGLGVGHFALVFNDNFLTSGNVTNGWTEDTLSSAPGHAPLFNGPPMFDSVQFNAPEPASFLLLGGSLLALAGLSRRKRAR